MNWNEAKTTCSSLDMEMLIIKNKECQLVIEGYIQNEWSPDVYVELGRNVMCSEKKTSSPIVFRPLPFLRIHSLFEIQDGFIN